MTARIPDVLSDFVCVFEACCERQSDRFPMQTELSTRPFAGEKKFQTPGRPTLITRVVTERISE